MQAPVNTSRYQKMEMHPATPEELQDIADLAVKENAAASAELRREQGHMDKIKTILAAPRPPEPKPMTLGTKVLHTAYLLGTMLLSWKIADRVIELPWIRKAKSGILDVGIWVAAASALSTLFQYINPGLKDFWASFRDKGIESPELNATKQVMSETAQMITTRDQFLDAQKPGTSFARNMTPEGTKVGTLLQQHGPSSGRSLNA